MKFYYTTSAGQDTEQKKKISSLGGYRSSTGVPNSMMNNLFGDISELTIQRNQDMCIGLVLRNETGAAITNVNLWFEYPKNDDLENISDSKYEVAAVSMTADSLGVLKMEHIDNLYSLPYSGDFYEAEEEVGKVLLGDMAEDAMLGIWIKRSLLIDKIQDDYDNLVEIDPDNTNIYRQVTLETEDEIKIIVEWD